MMPAPWLPVFLLLAAADWLALWQGWQRVNYLTKPAAMLALLIGFGWQGHFAGSLLWVGLGFGFSLLGDIFLLLSHGWFIYGLAAFLLAHVSTIIGFLFPCPKLDAICWLPALAVLVGWRVISGRLKLAMRPPGRQARLQRPVELYGAVLGLMLFSTLATLFRRNWDVPAAALAAAGGLLFFCSDSLLAFDRFVRPFPRARFWVRVTYHLGQLGLALGALLHALGHF